MKEKIIEVLKECTKAQTLNDINRKMHMSSMKEIEEMESALNELVEEGIVHKSKKHEYILMENTKALKVGVLRINKNGNGFVSVKDGEDVFVYKTDLMGAINGDFVEVEITSKLDDPDPSGVIDTF